MKIKRKNKKFVYIVEHHEGNHRFVEEVTDNIERIKKYMPWISPEMQRCKVISKWELNGYGNWKKVYDHNFNEWPGRFYLRIAINGFLHNTTVDREDQKIEA
jgi:hypothetical protein